MLDNGRLYREEFDVCDYGGEDIPPGIGNIGLSKQDVKDYRMGYLEWPDLEEKVIYWLECDREEAEDLLYEYDLG